jgi:hypothetical protein
MAKLLYWANCGLDGKGSQEILMRFTALLPMYLKARRARKRRHPSVNISGTSGIGSAAYIPSIANTAQSTTSSLPAALTNLNLSQTQQTQISQFLQNAQSGNVTSAQLKSEIESVLTPSQLAQLNSEHHGHHHHHAGQSSSSTDSTSGTTSDEDAFGVTIPTSTTSAGTQSISNAATTFWAQSQITPQSQT